MLCNRVRISADETTGPFSKSGVMISNTAAFEDLGWPVDALEPSQFI